MHVSFGVIALWPGHGWGDEVCCEFVWERGSQRVCEVTLATKFGAFGSTTAEVNRVLRTPTACK